MKIKIFSSNYKPKEDRTITFNPIYYYLKSFYVKNGKYNDKITWLKPEYHRNFDSIVSEEPDILTFSLYLWNREEDSIFARKLKKKLPNTKFVVGGPEVIRDLNIFDDFDWADYAIYGDGEEAFQLLVDGIIENDISKCVNLITREKIYSHKIFKFKDFETYSPYTDLKDEFSTTVEEFKSEYGKENVRITYQRVRGCPFKCSFCNWQAGLHWKVNTRTSSWKEEIDYLSDFGCNVRVIDANYGIYEEDVEILKYAMEVYKEKKNGFLFMPTNFSKVKKERVYQMLDMLLEYVYENDKLFPIKIALQDIDNEVLTNIDRPELDWNIHKKYIKRLRQKYKFANISPEVIVGLPGFSIEKYERQLSEFSSLVMSPMMAYDWYYLVNSPASNEEYLKKHDLEVVDILFLKNRTDLNFDDAVKENYFANEQFIIPKNKLKEIIAAKIYSVVYNFCSYYSWFEIGYKKNKLVSGESSRNMFDKTMNKIRNELDELAENIYSYMIKKQATIGKLPYCYEDGDKLHAMQHYMELGVKEILQKRDIKPLKNLNPYLIYTWYYKSDSHRDYE